jgi:hypothetical protein
MRNTCPPRCSDHHRSRTIGTCRSRPLQSHQGGEYVDAIHFSFAGGQVRLLLSLFSYLGTGESRERCLGVRIPATNLKPDYEVEARAFAHELADGFAGAGKRE